MVTPVLVIDSKEQWRPVSVDKSLDKFGYTWNKGWRKKGVKEAVDRIDFPSTMTPAHFKSFEFVGYHRVAVGGGLYWHQYWSWWPYNPKKYPPTKHGKGEHEGDWEMVQLGCVDPGGDKPILVTYSQHDGGEKREYWRVQLTTGDQPLVYVARDSHANYFEPHRDVTDTADGQGAHLYLNWLNFGDWANFTGQWGNSSNSPGPLTTRRAWQAPHAWHGQAR